MREIGDSSAAGLQCAAQRPCGVRIAWSYLSVRRCSPPAALYLLDVLGMIPSGTRHGLYSAARAARCCLGVTLMDTLVAVSLVSVLAGVAVGTAGPLLHSSSGRSATQQIASDLRLARMKAIAQNTRFRVVFNTDDGTYTVEREASPGNFVTEEGPFELPGTAAIGDVTPGDPVFDSRGAASAQTTITTEAPGGRYHTVTINVLGKVTAS